MNMATFLKPATGCKDGTLLDMEISTNGTIIDNRKLVFCVCRDITERKQAETERERLITAVNQAENSIVITDLHGNIEYVNPAFEAITGYRSHEVTGKGLLFLQDHEHSEDYYNALWEMIQAGKTWRGKIISKRKNGTLFTEAATISPHSESRWENYQFCCRQAGYFRTSAVGGTVSAGAEDGVRGTSGRRYRP